MLNYIHVYFHNSVLLIALIIQIVFVDLGEWKIKLMSYGDGIMGQRTGSFVFEGINDEPISRSTNHPDGLPGHLVGFLVRRKYVGKLILYILF